MRRVKIKVIIARNVQISLYSYLSVTYAQIINLYLLKINVFQNVQPRDILQIMKKKLVKIATNHANSVTEPQ